MDYREKEKRYEDLREKVIDLVSRFLLGVDEGKIKGDTLKKKLMELTNQLSFFSKAAESFQIVEDTSLANMDTFSIALKEGAGNEEDIVYQLRGFLSNLIKEKEHAEAA
jgi:hypothetical protein